MYKLLDDDKAAKVLEAEKGYQQGRMHKFSPKVLKGMQQDYLNSCDNIIKNSELGSLSDATNVLQDASKKATKIVDEMIRNLPTGMYPFPNRGGKLKVAFTSAKTGKQVRWRIRPDSNTGLFEQVQGDNQKRLTLTGIIKTGSIKAHKAVLREAAKMVWDLAVTQLATHNCRILNYFLEEATHKAERTYRITVVPELFSKPRTIGLFEDISAQEAVISISNIRILSIGHEYDNPNTENIREAIHILEEDIKHKTKLRAKTLESEGRILGVQTKMLSAHLNILKRSLIDAEKQLEIREQKISDYVSALLKVPSTVALLNLRGEGRKALAEITDLHTDHIKQARTLLFESADKTIKGVYRSTRKPIRSVYVEGVTPEGAEWAATVEYIYSEDTKTGGFLNRVPAMHKTLWIKVSAVDPAEEAQKIWETSADRSVEAKTRFGFGG